MKAMSDDMKAMSHENDGGLCWCGPICGPSFTWLPDDIQQVINERINNEARRNT